MAQPVIQASFNSGEWAPTLNARVDIEKYHSGAALLENFFVDYRGGATASPGTRFVDVTKFTTTTRLIPFQASFDVSYILEFGNGYVRFINNGAQVLSGGVPYEIASPYTAAELAQIKFAQSVNILILCHPNHPPYQLTLISAVNWTLAPIVFGSTVSSPYNVNVVTTLATGAVSYAYVVTAVDVNGQESGPSITGNLLGVQDIRSVAGTNTVSWGLVSGAASYNVYKAEPSYAGTVPPGSTFGFIGNVTGLSISDSNIEPDFSSGPPVIANPFASAGVITISVTTRGTYTVVPTVTISPSTGVTATAITSLQVVSVAIISGGTLYHVGDPLYTINGIVMQVVSVGGGGTITALAIVSPGSVTGTGNAVPSNPVGLLSTPNGSGGSFNLTWGLGVITITNSGSNYTTPPSVTIGSGGSGGAAVALIGPQSVGNPTVPGFFQQRLVLAGPTQNPQQVNMSQPGSYYNFNVTNPIAPDNAFSGSLVSGTLNTIQSVMPQPQGLIVLSDQSAWLINGGSPGAPVSAVNVVANAQVFAGASSPPPITAVDNILYVQAKSSIVRDLTFNFQKQVYTGSDISILSSHLFYGFSILEWAWAEEPFKNVYIVRNDGTMLVLTFLKEQELIAWSHRTTQGSFKSVATITETGPVGKVNAVYTVVQRIVNGVTAQYIERFVEQIYPSGVTGAWQVDAGLRYDGAAALSFSGAAHLAGLTVTGITTDDTGVTTVIAPFVMPVSGAFTLPAPPAPATGYTRALVGLPYTPKLQTLGIDTGNPTIQGKMKKLPEVTVRVNNTLGLMIGTDFNNLVPIDDLVVGNVGKDTNALVTDLVTGDARQALDPAWTVPGQYCIQQSLPYPATILGVIPQLAVGDTPK